MTYLGECLRKFLPNAERSFGNELSLKNIFTGSQYEYKGDYTFVHFTSLSGLSSILNSGFLRMSEFRHLDDNSELKYAYNAIENFPNSNVDKLKDNFFCLSMCEYSDRIINEEYMWKKYGGKGRGCAIVFNIEEAQYTNYAIGRVLYGANELKPIKKSINAFFNNYRNQQLIGFDYDAMLSIAPFHKRMDYKKETEVRLLFYMHKASWDEHKWPTIYKDITPKIKARYFNKLFFEDTHPFINNHKSINREDINLLAPIIKLHKIVLGDNLSQIEIKQVYDFVSYIIENCCLTNREIIITQNQSPSKI